MGMRPDHVEAAAGEIWRCWQDGSVMESLPEDLRPMSRGDGYAIQTKLAERSDRPVAGWKIAATSKAGQAHIGVDGPLAGRLHANRVHAGGAEIPFGHNRMSVAEPEFVFRLGKDLPPRQAHYSVEDVLDAVATLQGGIEFPDSRFASFETAGDAQLIADNACAHEFVLGDPMPDAWRTRDLAKHDVVIWADDGARHAGIGANVLGDPRAALCWIANELSRERIGLFAGQIITTGTCATPLPVDAGDRITVDYGKLGLLKASLAAV